MVKVIITSSTETDERLWDLYRSNHLTLLRKKPTELLEE